MIPGDREPISLGRRKFTKSLLNSLLMPLASVIPEKLMAQTNTDKKIMEDMEVVSKIHNDGIMAMFLHQNQVDNSDFKSRQELEDSLKKVYKFGISFGEALREFEIGKGYGRQKNFGVPGKVDDDIMSDFENTVHVLPIPQNLSRGEKERVYTENQLALDNVLERLLTSIRAKGNTLEEPARLWYAGYFCGYYQLCRPEM
jgi:hypothetical protein